MKPTDKVRVKMVPVWDVDSIDELNGLPSEVTRDYAVSDFEGALSYDPSVDDYLFDEDIAADQLADKLSDEFNFCVKHIDKVEFTY